MSHPDPDREPTLNKPLALIIEDDYDATVIFEQALMAAGFQTEVVRDGQTALERLTAIRPTLITLDLHLPKASGATILRKIKEDSRFDDTTVMLVTADPAAADPLREEADLILLKPVSFKQIRDLTSRLYPPNSIGKM